MPLRKKDYQNFKASCNQLLPAVELPLQVSEDDQNRFLNSVKALVNSERFSFVVDLVTLEITNAIGVDRWLGFAQKPLSMFDYLKIIHPNHVDQLMQMALTTLEIASQHPGLFKFMDQRMIACLPIRDLAGRYWWVKRESAAFQFDARGRLTAYTNLFTVVKEYNGESMVPRYTDRDGNANAELYEAFVNRYRERIRDHLPFTKRQFEILKLYAEDAGSTSQQVGQQLAISKQTIDKHNQSILIAARNHFAKAFHSATEVARFLREEKII
ncbi:LuxR C-terminal-related transcriptional regulator [Larkinella rosea]|uniref:DNA-binding response regulator n=1 Tax=Larkinella rosea TaxID=2025312 RepID=A0A3P1BFK4_9BACT|nr:response regulator transcription factor [Larkinella rosea]RRA99840.1 DNA-binding response regulator [Larkinella rosea]